MGFVERAFTPPGTGGREAAQIQANALAAKPAAPPPTLPTMSAAPPPPPTFQPGQSPGAKQRAQITASSMLGAAATGPGGPGGQAASQTARKTLIGQ